MKKIIAVVLLAISFTFTSICAFAQEKSKPESFLSAKKYNLLESISKLETFSYANNSITPIDAETLKTGLTLLPPERIDKALEGFKEAIAFFFNESSGVPAIILVFIELSDNNHAREFIKVEEEVLKAKDTAYKEYIKSSAYENLEIAAGETAFISRKVIAEDNSDREVTVIVAARGNYLIECNFLSGNQANDKMKKAVLDLWQVIAK